MCYASLASIHSTTLNYMQKCLYRYKFTSSTMQLLHYKLNWGLKHVCSSSHWTVQMLYYKHDIHTKCSTILHLWICVPAKCGCIELLVRGGAAGVGASQLWVRVRVGDACTDTSRHPSRCPPPPDLHSDPPSLYIQATPVLPST